MRPPALVAGLIPVSAIVMGTSILGERLERRQFIRWL
jgi:hypothetical protein